MSLSLHINTPISRQHIYIRLRCNVTIIKCSSSTQQQNKHNIVSSSISTTHWLSSYVYKRGRVLATFATCFHTHNIYIICWHSWKLIAGDKNTCICYGVMQRIIPQQKILYRQFFYFIISIWDMVCRYRAVNIFA